MPRANRLSPLRYACYYYRRVAAPNRSIIKNRQELEIVFDTLLIALRRCGANLYAFHIDPRELHLVLRTGPAPLVPVMGSFCQQVTRSMNRRRDESGSLFTERARVTLFQPEAWLLPIARYVHAIRLSCSEGLSGNSDGSYRARQRTKGLTTTAIVRSLSSSVGSSKVLDSAYSEYFDAPQRPEEVHLIERGSVEDSRILGDREFIAQVLRIQGATEDLDEAKEEQPGEVIQRAAEQAIGLFQAVCREHLGERHTQDWITRTNLEELRSKSRRTPLPFVRGMIADYVLARRLAKRSEIERFFGLQPKSLSAGLRQRYRSKLLELMRRGSGVARHRIPYLERGVQ